MDACENSNHPGARTPFRTECTVPAAFQAHVGLLLRGELSMVQNLAHESQHRGVNVRA